MSTLDKLPQVSITLDSKTNSGNNSNNTGGNSTPTGSNFMKPPPRRQGHRHRRSAAMSGDFDLNDLNSLLPPPNTTTSNHRLLSKSVPSSLSGSPIRPSSFGNYYNNSNTNNNNNINHNNFSEKFLLTPPIGSDGNSENSLPSSSSFANSLGSPLRKPASNFMFSTPQQPQSPAFSNNSLLSSSANTRFFITEDSTYEKNSTVPKALIDLDDIFNKQQAQKFKSNSDNVQSISSLPKHSALCSPKKPDMMFVEDIEEEEEEELLQQQINDSEEEETLTNNLLRSPTVLSQNSTSENSSLNSSLNAATVTTFNTSHPSKILMNNSSQNSLNSLNSNNSGNAPTTTLLSTPINLSMKANQSGMSKLNTSSISSLRNKVRYQGYLPNSPSSSNSASSSLTQTNSNGIPNKESLDSLRPTARSTMLPPQTHASTIPLYKSISPVRNVRFSNNTNTMSSSAPSTTPNTSQNFRNTMASSRFNPFQFESVSYEIPKNFHRDNDGEYSKDNLNNNNGSTSVIHHRQRSSISLASSLRSRSNSPSKRSSTIVDMDTIMGQSPHKSSKSVSSFINHRHSYSSSSNAKNDRDKNTSSEDGGNIPPNTKERHRRTSSLFSTISNKFSSHHRRKSSVISTSSQSPIKATNSSTSLYLNSQQATQNSRSNLNLHSRNNSFIPPSSTHSHSNSIIAKTTSDELINLQSLPSNDNETTLLSDGEYTNTTINPNLNELSLTYDSILDLGEPGPMVEVTDDENLKSKSRSRSRSRSRPTNSAPKIVLQESTDSCNLPSHSLNTFSSSSSANSSLSNEKIKGHHRRSSFKAAGNKFFGFFNHNHTHTSSHSHTNSQGQISTKKTTSS